MRNTPLRKGFRLREWDVLPKEGELRGSRGVRKLEPKVMQLLLCLANQAGRAVDRETPIDTVWTAA